MKGNDYRKRIFILIMIIAILVIIVKCLINSFFNKNDNSKNLASNNEIYGNTQKNNTYEIVLNENDAITRMYEIDDWRLVLVNSENRLPDDFQPDLANIDKTRQIDVRVIDELNQMLKDMKKDKITNIWIQSAYRSVEYQEQVFNAKIEEYIKNGETPEDAEMLTLQTINKPGTSDHNLGLAVDLNYVDYNFDKTAAFEWLMNNAENYGFILRYRKEKEDITKVNYEPWHWRYVGTEHAKKMNELDMCLEEYVEYLMKK